jgi:pseudaminic acid synthase
MPKEIQIENRVLGEGHPPFIIAEMSGNHNQSLDRALEIVDAAAASGAHCLKLQTYTADTMTLDIPDGDFFINDPKSLWNGESLYQLYQKAYTPWEWHAPIFDRCRKHGMIPLSTPFDDTAVDFLLGLGVSFFKIASFEAVDLPLAKKIGSTGKPVIASTGMSSLQEIGELVSTLRGTGNENIVLLKCTSNYPASPENSNLRTIPNLRDAMGVQVGLSDHTLGIGAAVASVALGATVIEKHFTLDRSEGGVDSEFSLEPQEMKALVDESLRAWQALGSVRYGTLASEKASAQFRRSIYVTKDIAAGQPIGRENIRIIRPGFGLQPKYFDLVLGKTAKHDLKRGDALTWESF